jgi:hypothetical protein
MSVWDEFKTAEDRWKPENPGDSIAGTIVGIRVATMPDQTRIPQLTVRKDDGSEVSLLASQSQLQRKLALLDPVPGQRIAIAFTHVENLQGGRTLKHFDVAVKPGEATTGHPAEPVAVGKSAADLI